MTRDQAIAAYRRVKDWERSAYARLLRDLEARALAVGVAGVTCPLYIHNWSIGPSPEAARLRPVKRWFDYHERRIWDEAARLSDAFARYF